MTSMRWMRGGLVVFMNLAQAALAQELDPPPGAAADEPPAPPPPPPAPAEAAPGTPLAESPYWGGDGEDQQNFEEEFGVETGDPAVDSGAASDEDFDARSESLAESSSLAGPKIGRASCRERMEGAAGSA